jgi:uncharacterized protein (DUF885 family)
MQRIGYLKSQLWWAAALVIDTELHTGKMSPKEGVDYLQRVAFASPANARAEIEKYLNWPGQALAYYVGKRELLETRDLARKLLGPAYDERKFHEQLLRHGSIPPRLARQAIIGWANHRQRQLGGPGGSRTTVNAIKH